MRENAERIEQVEIDLQKLLLAYLEKWWLIVICGVLVTGITLVCTQQFVTPMYRTSVSFYVNNANSPQANDAISSGNLNTSRQLVETYVNIIKSNRVMERVSAALNGNYTAYELQRMVSSRQVGDTEIFEIVVQCSNPVEAAHIANVIAEVAPDEIAYLIDGSSARVIDEAKVPTSYYSPDYRKNTIAGALSGCGIAILYLTLIFLLDIRLKSEEDLTAMYDYPILGRIPEFSQISTRNTKKHAYGGANTAKEQDGGK